MEMRHLIVFEYQDEDNKYTEWFWTKEKDALEIDKECYEWIAEANDFTMEETRNYYTLNNFWIVNDAVNKNDIK